ncbi:MAG: hypothetical protein AB8B91_05350 [Rubripirellula sp.]
MSEETANPGKWRRISVRALLLLMLVAASYMAGKLETISFEPRTQVAGTYAIKFNSGATRDIKIARLESGKYAIQGAGNLDGEYSLANSQLIMTLPRDSRFLGLIWAKQEGGWELVREPPNHPAGANYLGATLTKHPSE